MPSLGFDIMSGFAWGAHDETASESQCSAPETAEEFARHVIRAICHASVTPAVGRRTYERCMRALAFGSTTRLGLRHPGKADAIDLIWRERDRLYDEYGRASDKLAYLATLPWVGPVTRNALARRLGCPAEHAHRAVA